MPAANRPLAKPSKIRYFKGKAPELAPSDSESEEDEAVEQERQKAEAERRRKAEKNLVAGGAGRIIKPGQAIGSMKVELKDVKVEGGRVLLGGQKVNVQGTIHVESSSDRADTCCW
jgi:microfibrillar-associated protein 1